MSIELFIQIKPTDIPRRERFDEPAITIGRDPTSNIRFEMGADLEVSTRHAEIRDEEGRYVIVDRDSTNGTWVNGARLRGTRALHPGDVVQLGRSGPELRVAAIDDDVWHHTVENRVKLPPIAKEPSWRRQGTREYFAHVVETRTRTLKIAVFAILAGVLTLGVVGWLYLRKVGEDPQVWSEVTAPSIRRANDDAVVLIESEIPGLCSHGCEGTGFAIAPTGLIVTNRHVVRQQGVSATKLRVKFANTDVWLPARLTRAADDTSIDLALIQVSETGRYPTVVGLSTSGPDLAVGSTVLTIGFPLGSFLRMQGAGANSIAKTTMTTGSIGKDLTDFFQIDATADHGSSGSPVFDRHGHAIGVVSGGARDDADKIVYVIPSSRILELQRVAGLAKAP
jgi:hypothetical protein